MKPAVVLLSGGMDSAYCLHLAKEQHEQVFAVFVDYGQRNMELERISAESIARKAGVPLSLYEFRVTWNATLTALSRPLRSGTDEDGISNAFVPGRNLHLLTVAGARAREVGAEWLVIGCCANDADAFPDCRPEFLRAAANTLSLAYQRPLRVSAPLVNTLKAAYLNRARDKKEVMDAILESWSCYTPTDQFKHCGTCDACMHRSAAFGVVFGEK